MSNQPSDVSHIKRILGFGVPYWKGILLCVLLMSVYSAGLMGRLLLAKVLFDDVLVESSDQGKFQFDTLTLDVPPEAIEEIREEFFNANQLVEDKVREFKIDPGKGATFTAHITMSDTNGTKELRALTYISAELKAYDMTHLGGNRFAFKGGGKAVFLPQHTETVMNEERWQTLKWLCLIGVAISLMIGVMAYFRLVLTQVISAQILADLRVKLCSKLLRQPFSFFQQHRPGELMSRVTNDVSSTHLAISLLLGPILQQPLVVIGSVIVAFYLSWQLALIVFVVIPIIALPVLKYSRKIRKQAKKTLKNAADISHTMYEMFGGIRVVKTFSLENHQEERFRSENDEFVQISKKLAKAKGKSRGSMEFLYNGGSVLLLLLGGYVVMQEIFNLSLGTLAVFGGSIIQLYSPVKQMARSYEKLQACFAGADRVFELLDMESVPMDKEEAKDVTEVSDAIRFENVQFSYNDGSEVLKGVSFEAKAGEMTAIVGPTGAGKTTVTTLLLRLFDPDQGAITIDGTDLRDLKRESLLRLVTTVGQDPFLFHRTVTENIRISRMDATDEEVKEVARIAGIHDEIIAFEDGFETIVGDRGTKVSGGQRQRITIARAVLRESPVLILDEATSSLDSEKEQEVQAAIEKVLDRATQGEKRRTTIVIAHRLSTIRNADQIVVLESGKVAELGTHDELVAKDGIYAKLYGLQAGGETEETVQAGSAGSGEET